MRRVVVAAGLADVFDAAACSSGHDDVTAGNGGTSGGPTQDGAGSRDRSSALRAGSTDKHGSPAVDLDTPPLDFDAASAFPTVTSPAFAAGASIPNVHCCDRAGESSLFVWSGDPTGPAHDDELSSMHAPSTATLPSGGEVHPRMNRAFRR